MANPESSVANPVSVDPITVQVIQARLAGIVQEMQNSLFRTGYSTIIRESQDASCAILTCEGHVAAQHVVLPLHMGAFPACAQGVLRSYPPEEIPRGRRLHHQSSLPRRQPPRPGHVLDDADLLRRRVGGFLGHHGAQERHRRPCARELLEPGAGGVPGGTPGSRRSGTSTVTRRARTSRKSSRPTAARRSWWWATSGARWEPPAWASGASAR